MQRTKLTTVAALALAVGGVAATSFAATNGDDSHDPWAERPQVAATPPQVAGGLQVLRGRRDAGDVLPAKAQAIVLESGSTNQTGENVALSRRARSVSGGGSIYVVPGNGTTCLFLTTGAGDDTVARGGCSFTDSVIAGEQFRVASGTDLGLGKGEALAYGLAPDGVDSVKVANPDGTSTSAPVVGNVWIAKVYAGKSSTVTVGDATVIVDAPPPVPNQ